MSQDIELRVRNQINDVEHELNDDSLRGNTQQTISDIPEKPPVLKLLSSGFSFFVAGTNDGCIGALIPYILSSYHIGTSLVAVLYEPSSL